MFAGSFSLEAVDEAMRRFLLTLWNTYSFWVTYAALEGFDPSKIDVPVRSVCRKASSSA